MSTRHPTPRPLSYEDCLNVLLGCLGERVEVTIAPSSDELIIFGSFSGTLRRAREVPLWAGFAGGEEALFFTLDEDRRSGFVLYPSRFRSAYAEGDEGGHGVSIEQQDVRFDLWFG
jgi:hypothetical protein